MPFHGEYRKFLAQKAELGKQKLLVELLERSAYLPKLIFPESLDEFTLDQKEVEFILAKRKRFVKQLSAYIEKESEKHYGT